MRDYVLFRFGRVQKVERLGTTGFVVSFMDVRSAQKAHSTEPKFQGHKLRIAFHEQSKNRGTSGTWVVSLMLPLPV
uniref:RRM domain-containing protein n=1 Tax=Loa loa TaxID=7209 RepID=A0A1I7VHL4_LOALO